MNRDLYDLAGGKTGTDDLRAQWMIAVEAIVAENVDPEHQDRIKVIIPSVDQDRVYDKWVRPMVRFASPEGYADSHRPKIGAEVLLFGREGEKHNVYYVAVTNEIYLVPEELRGPGVRGLKQDFDYRLIADGDILISAGQELRLKGETVVIEAEGVVTINAERVDIVAPGGLRVNGVQMLVP